MNSLRALCFPDAVVSSFISCCRVHIRLGFSAATWNPRLRTPSSVNSSFSSGFSVDDLPRISHASRSSTKRTLTRVSNWNSEKSPYETLELERDANEDKIKIAYRRLAKLYHPDVYDGRETLEKGETAEARFIKIQAAYELLMDEEKRGQYDRDLRLNPMKASQAWTEWLMKKRRAFEQRGDMAIAAWAEQQQRELNVRVRRLSRSKIDPEEERRILAKEKAASKEYINNTLRRHTLVLKKRDLMRRKSEQEKKNAINQLLAAEGLELDANDDNDNDNVDESV
ncbi:uncharacterized protein LOC110028926 [Phalaenopsis equestris]|uniref:uncharacterized protein LOC110028926 n=1 Tax=Phalaenopsis equestris TaxID=78828 RepID=UPI0009E270A4|nr:uncharacterized protein LOC110028926 [Phalaenopsis equestris]